MLKSTQKSVEKNLTSKRLLTIKKTQTVENEIIIYNYYLYKMLCNFKNRISFEVHEYNIKSTKTKKANLQIPRQTNKKFNILDEIIFEMFYDIVGNNMFVGRFAAFCLS